MNIDVPHLIDSMVPESRGRSVRLLSDHGVNYRDTHFLSSDFPRALPKLYVTSEEEEFDDETLEDWRGEGFDVEYLPMGKDGRAFTQKLRGLNEIDRGPCETFGIVAYGDAAAICLEYYHVLDNNPGFKLGLLIAYYPTSMPDPHGRFPSSISVLVHLIADDEMAITRQSQMAGLPSRTRKTRRRTERGLGSGGLLQLAFPGYAYRAQPGFAEHDLEEYDRVSADLAWSRSLATARQAFNCHRDLELALERNVDGRFFSHNLSSTLAAYTTQKTPHVTNVPTLTGGIGADELDKFYSRFFGNPPSLKLTLLSRTVGADRVVDEIHVRFKHTQEMPWILPGVPATNRRVQVVVVSVVAFKGDQVSHEHVYWDQASVLVQVGLLDPSLVPDAARGLGVQRLPVVGKEAASRVLKGWDPEEDGEADNALISNWDERAATTGGEIRERGQDDGVSR